MAWAGAAMSSIGGVMQAGAMWGQGEMDNHMGERNANSAEAAAFSALEKGQEDERKYRVMARKVLGDMRTNYAASGVTVEGSPLDAIEESAATAELDAMTIKHNAKVEYINYMNQAQMYRYEGKMRRRMARAGAIGKLFTTAGQAMGMSGGGGGGGGGGGVQGIQAGGSYMNAGATA